MAVSGVGATAFTPLLAPSATLKRHPTALQGLQTDPPAITALRRQLLLSAIAKTPRLRNDLDLVVILQYLLSVDAFMSVSPQALHYIATECTHLVLRDGDVFCYQEDLIHDSSTALLVHAQEHTYAVAFHKDTLDRVVSKFGLTIERGSLSSTREITSTDLSHLAIFSHFTDSMRNTLLHTASRRVVPRGSTLFGPSFSFDMPTFPLQSFVLVLSGQIDVYWAGDAVIDPQSLQDTSVEEGEAESESSESEEELTTEVTTKDTTTEVNRTRSVLGRTPLYSIRRGHTIGEQSLGLALDDLYDSSSDTRTPLHHLPVRLVSGEDTTEVLLISKELYFDKREQDHVLQCYNSSQTSSFSDWVAKIFAGHPPLERSPLVIQEFMWRIRTDRVLSRTVFQFPPRVLERITQTVIPLHYTNSAPEQLYQSGSELLGVDIVLEGSIRVLGDQESNEETSVYHPGDLFGAIEVMGRRACSCTVYVDPGTTILRVPKVTVDRWLTPVRQSLTFNIGTLFYQHEAFSATYRPSQYQNMTYLNDKRKSLTAMARRISAGAAPHDNEDDERVVLPHADALSAVFSRMGLMTAVPRFLLRELLRHVVIVRKHAGEVIFHENEVCTALVILRHGFLAIYSLENLSTTAEMFYRHPFCQFSSLHHLFTKANIHKSGITEDKSVSPTMTPPLTRHRSAMYGVHLQTLHPPNAFRVGVLKDNNACPATIVAHSDCELLVVDQAIYDELLKKHTGVVDLRSFDYEKNAPSCSNEEGSKQGENATTVVNVSTRAIQLGPRWLTATAPSVALRKHLEVIKLPWLTTSDAKLQLLLRSIKVLTLSPGDRVLRRGDVVGQLLIVLAGSLTLYVRQDQNQARNVLDASQRSVRSLMLERNVTSNYSTTSHQLYTNRDSRGIQHKRAFLKHRVNRMVTTSNAKDAGEVTSKTADPKETKKTSPSMFVHSVLAAVRDAKLQQISVTATDEASSSVNGGVSPKRKTSLTFQSVVSKAHLLHRMDERRRAIDTPPSSSGFDEVSNASKTTRELNNTSSGSILFCHLHPGDVYGEECLTLSVVYCSPHDIFAELDSSAPTSTSNLVQLLSLDRRSYLEVVAKSDEEIEKELQGRASAARAKWQLVERKITRERGSVTTPQSTRLSTIKTPKLFDLLRNILNQRYYVMMRAISEIPVLTDIADTAKQELAAAARFEALERFANAYKDASPSSDVLPRYFIVLNGRIGLYPKTLALNGSGIGSSSMASSFSPSQNTTTATSAVNYASVAHNPELCLQEIVTGQGFGEFEILLPEDASRHHLLAFALEPTKLLSIPGELFVRHWPLIEMIRANIEYLRHEVQFFSRLEVERVSYLYHSIRFSAVYRGTKILEQSQVLPKGELFLIKDGECAIKAKVTVHPSAPGSGGDSADQQLADGPAGQTVTVLATIADVNKGHLFWIDRRSLQFTLQAISAQVTIAQITIDRLRLLLPKTHLFNIEGRCNQLAERFRNQLQLAQQTIVRLMNEKRAAELGQAKPSAYLPLLHYAMQAKPVAPPTTNPATSRLRRRLKKEEPTTKRPVTSAENELIAGKPPAIPYSRFLASRPIDLQSLPVQFETDCLSVEEITATREISNQLQPQLQNPLEHYQLSEAANNQHQSSLMNPAVLRGSFHGTSSPQSGRLPRLSRPLEDVNAKESQTLRVEPVQLVATPPMRPRSTGRKSPSSAKATRRVSEPPLLRLEVTLPGVIRATPPHERELDQPQARLSFPFNQVIANNTRAEREAEDVDEILDLRTLLAAKLQSAMSPLRSIRLKPSQFKMHSLGKYFESPTVSPHRNQQRQAHLAPPMASTGEWRAGRPRVSSVSTSTASAATHIHKVQTITRKQGFLRIVKIPSSITELAALEKQLDDAGRHLKTRFFAIVDNRLLEFPENVRVDENLLQSPAISTIDLTQVHVQEAPVVGTTSEVVLRHSFVLSVSSQQDESIEHLLLTCSSLPERKQWMNALETAALLGETPSWTRSVPSVAHGAPGSPRHRRASMVKLTGSPRSQGAHGIANTNERIEDDVLHVQFRIQ
ncbi:hypothetical protein Poli38472_002503 [Pythium oligandrum]|uniref:Cyclic nucleotide-binding domain-containing protein n=1 Tax=Pythium oligandrum TaxID=41045 RepID=A0A8K1CHM5_PYTOL|nr:hypothetical protein Poli38472_002503 [Pythium oligandrum]|eukprot:TMW63562.1 hypothetical protein Poli38472_002503 [Pythium oligandrum]